MTDEKNFEDFLADGNSDEPVNLEAIGVTTATPEQIADAINVLTGGLQSPEYVPPEELPEDEINAFRQLYKLSNETLGMHMHNAAKLQANIKTAKTAYKVDLYTKKFKKLKEKFQDELARNIQLETFFADNGIPPVLEDTEKTETPEDDTQ
jgi:hypothetical protein